MSSKFEVLQRHIIGLSEAQYWSAARLEWRLASVWLSEDPETCPCGQHPIYEICELTNIRNRAETAVSNVCVNNFMEMESSSIFSCLRRIRDEWLLTTDDVLPASS